MIRWIRWGAAAALVIWLLAMARREALRRGRRALAIALPLAGVAIICFLVAIFESNALVSNIFMLTAVLSITAAIGVMLWQGFR